MKQLRLCSQWFVKCLANTCRAFRVFLLLRHIATVKGQMLFLLKLLKVIYKRTQFQKFIQLAVIRKRLVWIQVIQEVPRQSVVLKV